ncbi:hypothetical protein T12_5736 [Trichinella patagoniensis]|uniref:Uncharacterized protein n=1 Tax=Trichinella patagoniensis TaxID=990121 RepID=A0A0V0Z408_9BILA|nr:hypothetical protein T12_5736 [Trichinella patagoniensis]
MRLIGKLFLWKMITLTILCEDASVVVRRFAFRPTFAPSLLAHAEHDCLAQSFPISRWSLF